VLWALMRKDFAQHAKPLLIFAATALALPLAFTVLTRTEKDSTGYIGTVFGCLGISAPMLLGQWLIGQEKVKGTFKLLRSLPVSETKIILTKYLFSTIVCLILVNGALLVEPAVCRLFGLAISFPTAPLVAWTNIAAVFFIAVSTTVFTILDARM